MSEHFVITITPTVMSSACNPFILREKFADSAKDVQSKATGKAADKAKEVVDAGARECGW
jgi:hypothetical protein